MGLDFQVRRASAADAAGLHECMRQAYTPYLIRLKGGVLPPLEADYAKEIASYPTWVVVAQAQIVAGLTMDFGKDTASISNVAVDPSWQGRGIGRVLLDLAEREAVLHGYAALALATHVLLHENVHLYQHLGWTETGRDACRVYMSKHIGDQTKSRLPDNVKVI